MRFRVVQGSGYLKPSHPAFNGAGMYEDGYFVHDNTTKREEWFPSKWRADNVARYLNDYHNGVFHTGEEKTKNE